MAAFYGAELLRMSSAKNSPASGAGLIWLADGGVPASPRAIMQGASNCGLSGNKLYAAVLTRRRAADIARLASRRARRKLTTARSAWSRHGAVGKPPGIEQGSVIPNPLDLLYPVTGPAKGSQVTKPVGLLVVAEKVIWTNVMDRQALGMEATPLTSVLVSSPGFLSLGAPVRAAVLSVATEPCGVVLARPFLGCSPLSKALSITEVMHCHGIWLLFDGYPACMASDLYPFTPGPDPIRTLPHAITGRPAKVQLRDRCHVGLGRIWLFALLANQGNHSPLLYGRNGAS